MLMIDDDVFIPTKTTDFLVRLSNFLESCHHYGIDKQPPDIPGSHYAWLHAITHKNNKLVSIHQQERANHYKTIASV